MSAVSSGVQAISSPPPGEWTLETLRSTLSENLSERDRRYEQRFTAQEKAVVDAFAAQEKAVSVAFAAQEKAVAAALIAQEKAVAAALAAAKEAVAKAEAASEKRFEAMNEFRGQLADQAATFLPRPEYAAGHQALIDKVASGHETLAARIEAQALVAQESAARNTDSIAGLGIRIERSEGQRTGLKDGWGYLIGAIGAVGGAIGIAVAIASH